MDYKNLSLIELSDLIKNKEATSAEIYDYFLERTKKYNEELNAFNTLPEEFKAMRSRHIEAWDILLWKAEQDFSQVRNDRAINNLPIAIKDIFCEKWIRTTASSKMLEDFVPPYESTVTDRMKQAGFVSFWKTNMDEYAMWGSGENSAFGPARNPWDPTRIPGGSSSGSAVAVAAWLVPAALGTDTGGSIRQPASMCGIVGWKPWYGRNSRYGVIAMASSLDTPWYFTRTVRDASLLYETTAGYDPLDATSLTEEVKVDPSIWERQDLRWVKIGIPKEYFIDGIQKWVEARIREAITELERLGAEIIEISLPHTSYGISAYYIICPAEVSSNMGRYDGIRYGHKSEWGFDIAKNREEWLGPEVKRRSLVGSYVLSSGFYDAYYKKATAIRELIRDDFKQAFAQVDVIVAPTAPTVAWKIGSKWADPLALYLEDVFTIPASLAGIPGLTIPVGYASPADDPTVDLPVGLQILGPLLGEEKCLMVGHVLEGVMKEKVDAKRPKIW
jgi:aspartyl-tRNA(Asn)/glutamyl-tRNA(Gln) amidotransferase subunit A